MLRTTESNIKGWIQIHSIESAKPKERKVIKSKVNGKTKTKENGLKLNRNISKDESVFIMKVWSLKRKLPCFFLKESRKLKAV